MKLFSAKTIFTLHQRTLSFNSRLERMNVPHWLYKTIVRTETRLLSWMMRHVRAFPTTLAEDIMSVQPLTAPTGKIFKIRLVRSTYEEKDNISE